MTRTAAVVAAMHAQSGPFEWGTRDCVALANETVMALTGRRVLVPTWADEAGAVAEIERRGGLFAATCEALGHPSTAAPEDGDVVLIRVRGVIELLGVWFSGYPVVHARRGLMRANPARVAASWRV